MPAWRAARLWRRRRQPDGSAARTAFTRLSEQHFERSKLVVLGSRTRIRAARSRPTGQYERQLASSLLTDTRLYRLAAEERGMTSLASVMADLELVLLQTSMAQESSRDDSSRFSG